MTKFGAIDVGSNAVRLGVFAEEPAGKIIALQTERASIRLGKDVFQDGVVQRETIERLIVAFEGFQKSFEDHKVDAMRAVGTSALRDAKNREDVVEQVFRATGLRIEIISGDEEAALIYRAIGSQVDLGGHRAILVEIGGGSIELSIVEDGNIILSDCLAMGTVRLLQLLEEGRTTPRMFQRLVREYARTISSNLAFDLKSMPFEFCVGTGGNIEELHSLKQRMLGGFSTEPSPEGTLTAAEVEHISTQLQELTFEERVHKLGLREDRADVIVPAAIVFSQILEQAGVSKVIVPRVGLREGVAFDLIDRLSPNITTPRRVGLMAYAAEIGHRFDFNETHGRTVAALSAQLFDQTAELHGLDSSYRLMLELAAMLHDIGQAINYRGHHKHSYYILSETPFIGLSKRERQLVASLARYHRKSAPKPEHESFSTLNAQDRDPVVKLAALLRVADALDRNHNGAVSGISLRDCKSGIKIRLEGDGDFLLERWAVKQKGKLFSEVFKTQIAIEESP